MSKNSEVVTVAHHGIKLDADHHRAVLFYVDWDDGDECWIPRSLLEDYDDETFVVPEWKAEEIGVDYE